LHKQSDRRSWMDQTRGRAEFPFEAVDYVVFYCYKAYGVPLPGAFQQGRDISKRI